MHESKKTEIVLLPGLHGTGHLFADFVRQCPPRFVPRVIEYPRDRILGYGGLLPLVRQQLPKDSDFVILGESFSGPLAVMLGAERPRGLKAVVLVATFVTRPRPRWTGVLPWGLLLKVKAPRVFLRWLLAGWKADPELIASLHDVQTRVHRTVLAARIREVLRVNVVKELQRIAVPVLYLQGAGDRLIRAWAARRIRRAKPEVVVARIAAPHLVLQTAPGESWENIDRLVRESGRAECSVPGTPL